MKKKLFSNLKGDFNGGITSAMISIPQSIAYGIIAFSILGPEYTYLGILAGLYSSIFAGLAAALLGTPAMITGAGAATTLIFVSLVSQISSSHYFEIGYANPKEMIILLAFFTVFLSGLLQFFFGVLRLGNILKFVPYPVVAGFINGSAILIIISQIYPLTGIDKSASQTSAAASVMSIEPWTLLLGLSTALCMWFAPKFTKKIPSPFIALAAGTLLYHFLKLVGIGKASIGSTLGFIPAQLPSPGYGLDFFQTMSSDMLFALAPIILPAALSLAILGSIGSLLTSVAIEGIAHTRSDGNKELLGQGIGNMLSAGFGGLSGSSSLMRSLPNINAGGKTALSGVISSLFILGATIFLAPVMEIIPHAVIAGIMLVVGIQLFDKWTQSLLKMVEIKNILLQKELLTKLIIIFSVVLTVVIFNLIAGVIVGVAISIFIFVAQMSKSLVRKVYFASSIPSRTQRDDRIAVTLSKHSHTIAILELEGVLFFGSADQLDSKINNLLKSDIQYIILDMKRLRLIDSSGVRILMRIYINLINKGKNLGISYIEEERRRYGKVFKGEDRRFTGSERTRWKELKETGLLEALGKSSFFPDTDSAINYFENQLLQNLSGVAPARKSEEFGSSSLFRGLDKKELEILRSFMEKRAYKKQ